MDRTLLDRTEDPPGFAIDRLLDVALSAGGIIAPWWLRLAAEVNLACAVIAAVGGVVLLFFRIYIAWKEARGLK